MSLGLKAYHTGGEFSPRLEYNAKSGRASTVDRTADGTGIIKIDVTMSRPAFAWDVGSIEIGWINFQSGAAPSFVMAPYGQPMPARPDRNHKAGFRSKVWDGRTAFAREFSATAGATVNAIEELWDTLTAMSEAAAGKVPVIQLVDVVPTVARKGTNYAPLFKLHCWVERNEAVFGPRTVAPPGAAPIVAAAPAVVTPPVWQAAPAAAPVAAVWPVAA
jgi:hypothetical protein